MKSGSLSSSKNDVPCDTIKIHACIGYVYFREKRSIDKFRDAEERVGGSNISQMKDS